MPIEAVNRLLAHIPTREKQRLQQHLEPVPLPHGTVLYESRSTIEYAYFPRDAVLSALVVMSNGAMIEVATVGNEGGLGLHSMGMRQTSSPHRVIVQVGGDGWRCSLAAIAKEVLASEPLQELLAAYNAALAFQISQSVACNGLHPILQRCCRWLLMTHDRVVGDEVPLTHEFLAAMLGVRRSGVTEVLQTLKSQGLIDNRRGTIVITDREGMLRSVCECYQDVKDEYERLLGPMVS